ncbi:hypothetical protein BJV74DRAFT_812182 [Russula compacta]|nr:hypothetical protein BJV74DRAFT_812182 [Russula compacta]
MSGIINCTLASVLCSPPRDKAVSRSSSLTLSGVTPFPICPYQCACASSGTVACAPDVVNIAGPQVWLQSFFLPLVSIALDSGTKVVETLGCGTMKACLWIYVPLIDRTPRRSHSSGSDHEDYIAVVAEEAMGEEWRDPAGDESPSRASDLLMAETEEWCGSQSKPWD